MKRYKHYAPLSIPQNTPWPIWVLSKSMSKIVKPSSNMGKGNIVKLGAQLINVQQNRMDSPIHQSVVSSNNLVGVQQKWILRNSYDLASLNVEKIALTLASFEEEIFGQSKEETFGQSCMNPRTIKQTSKAKPDALVNIWPVPLGLFILISRGLCEGPLKAFLFWVIESTIILLAHIIMVMGSIFMPRNII